MERDKIIAILGILKTAYPRFYMNMTRKEAEDTINLWQEMFKDIDSLTLTMAVKSLITHFEYPPTIAEVKKEILRITTKQENNVDYWQEAYNMMSNANYMTKEEFDTHSDICKRFFGNVDNLRSYGIMEKVEVNNNIQPRFLRYAESYITEKKNNALLPNDIKNMIQQLAESKTLKLESERDKVVKEIFGN